MEDLKLHAMIDKLNPDLRSRDEINGKKRVREFYSLSAQDAYDIFEAMAEIHGTTDRLKKYSMTKYEAKQEEVANSIAKQKREKFEFAKLGIPVGTELVFVQNPSIKVVVADEKRKVLYNNEEWSLSALSAALLHRNSPVQGTLYFSYNGEVLADMRDRMETANLYG